MTNAPVKYAIELRNKDGELKQQLQPWAKDVNWQWNRKGGCGRCSIKLAMQYRKTTFNALDDIRIFLKSNAADENLPYAHYKCNDNAASTTVTDDGTGANNGTSSVNTSTLNATGKINDGFDLEESSSHYVDIDSLLTDISSDTEGSISFWFKVESTIPARTILSFSDTDSTNTIHFFVFSTSLTVYFISGASVNYGWICLASISTDTWYNVVVTFDGTTPYLYLNSVESGTRIWGEDDYGWFSGFSGLDNGRIGCINYNSAGNSEFFDGIVDDVRYYKTALSQESVNSLYNRGNGTEDKILDNLGKLVYRGWVAGANPVLKDSQEIILDVRGYFDLLKHIIVQDSDAAKTYTSDLVSDIVDDIVDTFIVANTDITKGTIDTAGYTADSMSFKTTVESALKTLADLEGGVEYGVDENLVFFWYDEGTTVAKKFIVGDNIKTLQRKVDYSKLVNKYYLEGKQTAGVPYTRTGENSDSQSTYYLSEKIIQNGAISTNSVADQYISALLAANDAPKFQMNLNIPNTNVRLEDNIPIGKISIYDVDYDEFSASRKIWGTTYNGGDNVVWGTTAGGGDNFIWGGGSGVFQDQVDFIKYKLSNTDERFNINIGMGGYKDETAGKIKQIQLDIQNLTQGRA